MKTLIAIFFIFNMPHFLWANLKVLPPGQGAYIGAYTDAGGGASDVREGEIREFENLIGKKIVWNYFSNNWLDGRIEFPTDSVIECDKADVIPYIRLLPWVEMRASGPDPYYKMIDFAHGIYNEPLRKWAQKAKEFGKPLMLEFGPEVNGDWFAWNGKWNGGGERAGYGDPNLPDGPETFRDAFREVIEVFRSVGADNVTWVFHVDTAYSPHTWWNEASFYYPGDEYIDWIGLSVFGAQLPNHKWYLFTDKLNRFWSQVESLSLEKPVMISEFAVIESRRDSNRKARWLEQSLKTVRLEPKFSRIKAITYWNSPGWLADGSADFRITSSPQSLETFREEISHPFWLDQLEGDE